MEDRWLSTKEAAAYVGAAEKTIYRALAAGVLRGTCLNPRAKYRPTYRFKTHQLDAWLMKNAKSLLTAA